MGLLRLFFNRWLLSFFFIIVAVYLFLQVLGWSMATFGGLSLLSQIVTAVLVLAVSLVLTTRLDRLRPLSGLTKFLFITVVPLLFIFNMVVSAPIPYPMSVPMKLSALSLPFIVYVIYRKRQHIGRFLSSQTGFKHHWRLKGHALLPKGLEEGHIVYGAGRRGFKVLKFIEVRQQHASKTRLLVPCGNGKEMTKRLMRPLIMARKLGIETSLDMFFQDGAPLFFVSSACEGRDYRKCRAIIDDFSRTLSDSIKAAGLTSLSVRPVDDNTIAKKVLMAPFSTKLEDVEYIESDGYNVKVLTSGNSGRTTRLRLIHLIGPKQTSETDSANIVDELDKLTSNQRTLKNFAVILHVKPLPESVLCKELVETGETYQYAMSQVVEQFKSGILTRRSKNRILPPERQNVVADATRRTEEAKNTFKHLKEAESSGYFEVSLTILGEPPVAESISRVLSENLSSLDSDNKLSVVRGRLPDVRRIVRRDLASSLGKVSGKGLASLVLKRSDTFATKECENGAHVDETEATLPRGKVSQ
ncbi:MAG: hypothetical protein WED05_12535 [Candidatus Atabeyarchaeum deiterrae]